MMTAIDNFLDTGFVNLGEIIDKKQCKELMKLLHNLRSFEQNFFKKNIKFR